MCQPLPAEAGCAVVVVRCLLLVDGCLTAHCRKAVDQADLVPAGNVSQAFANVREGGRVQFGVQPQRGISHGEQLRREEQACPCVGGALRGVVDGAQVRLNVHHGSVRLQD